MNMETITLTFNGNNATALSMLESIRKSGVFQIEEHSPYDKAFVDRVLKSRAARGEGKAIKVEDLWK